MYAIRSYYALDTTVDEDAVTHLADLIKDENAVEPFEEVFCMTLQDTISDVLKNLNQREITIITLRFGLNGEGPSALGRRAGRRDAGRGRGAFRRFRARGRRVVPVRRLVASYNFV